MKKIKDIFIGAIEEHQKRNDERERIERERIQAQMETLKSMSEKELMVKVILELERLSARLNLIEKVQKESKYSLDSLDSKMLMISISIDELKYK